MLKNELPERRGASVPAVLNNAKNRFNNRRRKPSVGPSASAKPRPLALPASKPPAAAAVVRPRRAASQALPPPPPPCRPRACTTGPAPQRTALASDRPGGGGPRIIRCAESGAILEAWPVDKRPDAPVLGDEPVCLSDGRIKPRTKREADEQLELQWQTRRKSKFVLGKTNSALNSSPPTLPSLPSLAPPTPSSPPPPPPLPPPPLLLPTPRPSLLRKF